MKTIKTVSEGPIVLFGASLDTWNRGVSALSVSTIALLKHYDMHTQIMLVYGSRSRGRIESSLEEGSVGNNGYCEHLCYRYKFVSPLSRNAILILAGATLYRVLPIGLLQEKLKQIFPILSVVVDSKYVADIWGDSFSDIYGVARMMKLSFGSLLAIILNKSLVLLPQTYGPYRSRISIFVAKGLVKYACKVMTRSLDENWLEALKLRESVKPVFCPDVAFTLPCSVNSKNRSYAQKQEEGHCLIGINISGLLYSGGYTGDNMFCLAFDYRKPS